ncbi:MAG: hypothetical protein ABIH59_03730 [archaeon]
MGRTQLAKASINEIKKNIQIAKTRKKKLIDYKNKLHHSYAKGKISYAQYLETLHKKTQGRNLQELIHYYDYYISECEKQIKKHKKHIHKNRSFNIFLFVFILSLILVALYYIQPSLTGFATQTQISENEFTQTINLQTNQSTIYEWILENQGTLTSIKLDGSITKQGSVKIYLDNLLILDSSNLQTSNPLTTNTLILAGITKSAFENITNNTTKTTINISNSEEINQSGALPKEDLSPSQEEPTLSEINKTEENITKEKPKKPISPEKEIIYFSDICQETCDLSFYGLNSPSYLLRIEISNSELIIENIKYTILQEAITTTEKEISLDKITKSTEQFSATLNQPVKWKKIISATNQGEKIKILENSEKINLKKITGEKANFKIENKNLIIQDTEKEFELTYETPAPYSEEETTSRGKKINVIGPENIHYKNVLIFTDLSENLNIKNPDKIKIYWVENNSYLPIHSIQDKNNNKIYDYLEFIAPHLSNQTFEIGIVIYDAEHINPARNFITNIYDYVNQTDNITYTIPKNHYARAYFEKNLSEGNVIDVYVKTTEPAILEIYEKDSNQIVGTAEINKEGMYYITLNNYTNNNYIFDLKSTGNDIIYDYIHDANELLTGVTLTTNPSPPGTIAPGESFTMNCNYAMGSGKGISEVVNIRWQYNNGGWTNIPVGSGDLYVDSGQTNPQDYTNQPGTPIARTIYGSTENTYDIRCEAEETSPNAAGPFQSTTSSVTVAAADETYPQFTTFVETPANTTQYTPNRNYSFNVTITESNGTAWISFEGTNTTATNRTETLFNVTFSNLAAGNYYYNWSSYGSGTAHNFNMTGTILYNIAQNTSSCSVKFNETSPINYGKAFLVWSNCTSDFTLYRNGSTISNNSLQNLGAAGYNLTVIRTDNANYSNYYDEQTFAINKINPYANLTNDTNLVRDFDTTVTNIGSTNNNNGDSDVSYNIFENNSNKGSSHQQGGAGFYTYILNTTGGENYTANISLDTFDLRINPIAPTLNFSINDSEANITIEQGETIDLNCTTLIGDSSAYLTLYRDGTKINNATSPIGNATTFNTIQVENITCRYQATQNYTTTFKTWWVNVTTPSNQEPEIIIVNNDTMTDISGGPNEGPSPTIVQINFTAYDADGFENLNDNSATINFSKIGETSRINSSCTWLADYNTNYANYTCTVVMWWWDGAGTWNIAANISDISSATATNNSKTFDVGTTDAVLMAPTSLNWSDIVKGATNQEAINNITLNNTGNVDKNIEINATNLRGETNPLQAIWAGNFSVRNISGCEGTSMVNDVFIAITSATLPSGNYTLNFKNETSGQEELAFCIEEVGPELIAQAYSTANTTENDWTIRVVLVALSFRRRKKKKNIKDSKLVKALILIKQELKEEYSESKVQIMNSLIKEIKEKYKTTRKEIIELIEIKETTIPINIFSSKLGALEALTKYLKENLSMNYKEIALLTNRNERTIWTSYKKAFIKMPEKIKIKEITIKIPIKIFKNKKLTIFESVIIYLREKQIKYSEIAKILNRDPRNIYTIFSRATKKTTIFKNTS